MSADIKKSLGLKKSIMTSLASDLANGVIYVYSGSMPSDPDAAEAGTHIGTVTLNGGDFTFGVATNGLNLDVQDDGSLDIASDETWICTGESAAGASGTNAGYAVFYPNASGNTGEDASGTKKRVLLRMGVSSGFFRMNNTLIQSGGKYTIDSCNFTWPAE